MRDDDRHLGRLRVVDRLDGLRHHAVVGGHHQHHHVGHVRAAGTHGRERLVAGRIDEDDCVRPRSSAPVRADLLRDAARFTGGDVGLANLVQQRRLAVVDVAQDGDDRRPRLQLSLIFPFEAEELRPCLRHDSGLGAVPGLDGVGHRPGLHLDAELVADGLRGAEVDGLVGSRQHARRHQLLDDVRGVDPERIGELAHGQRRRHLDRPGLGRGLGQRAPGLAELRARRVDGPGGSGAATLRVSRRWRRKLTSSEWLIFSSRASSCAFMLKSRKNLRSEPAPPAGAPGHGPPVRPRETAVYERSRTRRRFQRRPEPVGDRAAQRPLQRPASPCQLEALRGGVQVGAAPG